MQITSEHSVYNANLLVASCQFDVNQFDDALFSTENIVCPPDVQRSVTKRRAEYFTGRYLATLCLAQAGIRQFVLSSDAYRCPVWPAHLTGSISHCNDAAICLVAKKENYSAVGVDTENWIVSDSIEDLIDVVINQNEKDVVKKITGDIDKYGTHIFSAKESLFKALYPQVKRYFNFSAAELTDIDFSNNILHFELTEDLADLYPQGLRLRVQYAESAGRVTTWCLLEN